MSHSPRLTLIVGCMFAGKTTELLRRLRARPSAGVCVLKHGIDTRYDHRDIVSHDGDRLPAATICEASALDEAIPPTASLVAIDEVHFFPVSLDDTLAELMDRRCLSFVLTGLDRDSWGRSFSVIARLRRRADQVTVQTSRCGVCGEEADCTQRLTPIIDGNLVGGRESFEPRCRKHWSPPPEAPPADIAVEPMEQG